jgi:hypothetical protein
MAERDCVFCDLTQFRTADVCIENDFCLYASTRDPRDPPDVLPGCGVIIPLAHRQSPFDFTPQEWAATHDLLLEAKAAWMNASRRTATCWSGTARPTWNTPTFMSSLASTTSRSPIKAVARPSRWRRTAGRTQPHVGAAEPSRLGRVAADRAIAAFTFSTRLGRCGAAPAALGSRLSRGRVGTRVTRARVCL